MKNFIKTALLVLTLSVAQGVAGHTSFPKEIKCPIDETEFTIYVTGSYTTFGTMKDFQKFGAIGDLYESRINACPKCHFSGHEKDFEQMLSDSTKADILQILEPYKNQKIDDAMECEIAAKIYLYQKDSYNSIANMYLLASYCLKKTNETNRRKEMQKECIKYLQKAIENNEFKADNHANIYYLIGELYRRTGQFDMAIKYFDMAINDENKQDWIEKIAKEQKQMAIKKDDDNDI
jgi:uncharacterized protein (DUF2225 family)